MPIYPAWDYQHGGSYGRAQTDIIREIGPRPGPGWTLHVVCHDKGLVPGNLVWAGFAEQTHEQVRKIAARQRHEIKVLREEVRRLPEQLRQLRTKFRQRKRSRL